VGGGPAVAGASGPAYEVRLHPTAAREYRRLQGPLRDRIRVAIDDLAADPRPRGAVKLVGRDDFRIRVADYRVVYAVDDAERLVLVARIAHRREVYRR
jgi:mRNA interferase RelE/StbE